jgi:hypothetical protein
MIAPHLDRTAVAIVWARQHEEAPMNGVAARPGYVWLISALMALAGLATFGLSWLRRAEVRG